MTTGTVLITGATGTIGGALVERLAADGVAVRTLTRDEAKARSLRDRGVDATVGDLLDPASLAPALAGVRRIFLATPISPDQVAQAVNLIRAAKESGHRPRIVRLSVQQASHDAPTRVGRQHAAVEDALAASGLPYTVLRPQSFMQNTLAAAPTVAAEGAIYQPFGAGRLAMVDARDVAEAAATVLTEAGHDGAVYTLTGPTAISVDEVAEALGEALGRPVRYVPVSTEVAKAGMLRRGVSEWLADALNEYAQAHAAGYSDFTTDDVERLTGHPATPYRQFARDVAWRFRCN